MKKYALFLPISVGLFLALMVTSCSMFPMLTAYPGNSLIVAIDKADMSLLNYAPEIKAMVEKHVTTPEQEASFHAFAVDMIERTKAADPDFYKDFVDKINSDDSATREEALKEGEAKLGAQIKAYFDDPNLNEFQIFGKIFSTY